RSRHRLRARSLAFDGQLQQPENKCYLPGVLCSLDGMRQQDGEQTEKEEDGAVEPSSPAPRGVPFGNSAIRRRGGGLHHFRRGAWVSRRHQGSLVGYTVAYTTGIKP